jgi:hypothetical protein
MDVDPSIRSTLPQGDRNPACADARWCASDPVALRKKQSMHLQRSISNRSLRGLTSRIDFKREERSRSRAFDLIPHIEGFL